MEKIQYIVGHDLIGTLSIEHMTPVDKIRYTKQCSRLYESCYIYPPNQEYVNERYDSLVYSESTNRLRLSSKGDS